MRTVYETERLIVRPWSFDIADLDRVQAIYSHPEVVRWFARPAHPMADRSDAITLVERWRARNGRDPRLGVWAVQVRDTGVVAGTLLYKLLPNTDGSPATDVEIGWHLHPDCWGHGYATEGARGALARGFALGVPEVFAVVQPHNTRSRAVCRRLDMVRLGTTRRWYATSLEAFRSTAPVPGAPVPATGASAVAGAPGGLDGATVADSDGGGRAGSGTMLG